MRILALEPYYEVFFYDGTAASLAARLRGWTEPTPDRDRLARAAQQARACITRFDWSTRAPIMDGALKELA